MTPLVPWLLFGSGLFLSTAAVKNRSPKATLVAMLRGKPLPTAPWYPLPVMPIDSDLASGGAVTGGIGGTVDPGSAAGGAVSGGAAGAGARAVVVNYARAQLGEPYVFASSGPNTWDCSGLTMMAYRQVGIRLPHHAASQQQEGKPVEMSNAQPGDLVFWGPVSGHVAMWLGGGQVIHAPHVGTVVKISPIWDVRHARFRSYL